MADEIDPLLEEPGEPETEEEKNWAEYVKRDDLEQLLDMSLSDWQWRWVDLIVNKEHSLEREGPYFVMVPRRR